MRGGDVHMEFLALSVAAFALIGLGFLLGRKSVS